MIVQATQSDDRGDAPSRWLLVECGDAAVSPLLRIAGLSLLGRHLKLAARLGFAGVVLRGGREVVDALGHLPSAEVPESLAIETLSADDDLRRSIATTVDLAAVYDKSTLEQEHPEPLCRLHSVDDVHQCGRVLETYIRKTIDQDGFVSYFAFRPLSRAMTRVLINTPVMPNHISLTALCFGIAAAVTAGLGGVAMFALAGVLYWVGAVVDCVDGELARLRLQSSKIGEWIDTLADDVSTYGLMAGLGVGLYRHGADPLWLYVGVGGAILGFLLQARIYVDLHRWGLTIDTAQYPWFFGTPSDGDAASGGLLSRLTYVIGFLFRRDAFVTMIAIALLAGAARVAVVGLLVGLGIFAVIFATHTVVMAVRGSGSQDVSA